MRRIFRISGITMFFLLTLLFSIYAAEETLTITTYYPTPQGSYNNLDVAGDLTVGGTVAVGTTNPGTATVAILSTVGIGTTAPTSKLEVSGDIALSKGASRAIKIPSGGESAGNDLTISAGDSEDEDGGKLVLKGGHAFNEDSAGGKIELTGATLTGNGGDVLIGGGNACDSGGDVNIYGGDGD